ncbi:MAG TPA: SAM-dependent methyltransferase, partial [Phycisphaerales bacterium]|nr:SAM-dependent methyltransferase [Phycisphaerales bacterium]
LFVSRGGLKLHHALTHFNFNPSGLTAADFGCNLGGFTDCLLQHGAAHVYAVDTSYGTLAWKLRNDPRITVLERTNAIHAAPPIDRPIDLVVIDMGWTTQDKCIPAALKWLRPDASRWATHIITLIKPHYESHRFGMDDRLREGVLDETDAEAVLELVTASLPSLGVTVRGVTKSPITGGATKGNKQGNTEWLALLTPAAPKH